MDNGIYAAKSRTGKILCAVILVTLSVVLFGCMAAAKESPDIFDPGFVHQMDIVISEEDWSDLLAHPADKTKYKSDISIDGETVREVSFATKGTSSLVIASNKPGNSRYSFKIKFGNFVEGQTWHTLRELNLQSMFADATYMKDHLCYSLFRRMGVPAPRSSYVWLTVNGKDFGLYLAVEELDDQFLDQLNKAGGNLYKPENDSIPKAEGESPGIPGKDAAASSGADLVYTDDRVDSYPDIFDNTVTKKNPESQESVIRSLHSLRDLQELENHLNTREIILYFAVHNFVGNYDSYTGPKPHNYLLYESSGKLSLFPWDYNLAFGAFPSDGQFGHVSDSTWVVNQGIDTPLVCVSEKERPMWRWIVSDAAYLGIYHEAMERLIAECFDSGAFEKEIDEIHDMIAPYVEKDPTAYYSPEEFETATHTLREIALLRAESIRRQLAGTLSTYTDLQSESDRVAASQLSVKDMGVIEE